MSTVVRIKVRETDFNIKENCTAPTEESLREEEEKEISTAGEAVQYVAEIVNKSPWLAIIIYIILAGLGVFSPPVP